MLGPAETLLLESFHPEPGWRVLLLEGGDGRLAEQLANRLPDGELHFHTNDLRDLHSARARLAGLERANVGDHVFPSAEGVSDAVLLPIPKGRRYARTLLLAAWRTLRPGGQLLLAGPTKAGAKAVITDAKRLFGNANVLATRRRHRVATCLREEALSEPLPAPFLEPGIAPGTVHEIIVTGPSVNLTLASHPGIFSWNHLDEGTTLLLEHLPVEPGERVYDFGCGYGVLGLAAAQAGAEQVAMSDVNLLAVHYSRLNAERNGLSGRVNVFAHDNLATDRGQWDLILSNPPFHRGHEVDTSVADELIGRASSVLAANGRLRLVANRFLAYDKRMAKIFPRVARVAETNRFHILEARLG